MPTIRELVTTTRHREGVDAAIVVGRDGLLMAGPAEAALDRARVRVRSADAVLLPPGADIGPLLYALRRNREQTASLV
jgi:hypothetical protein